MHSLRISYTLMLPAANRTCPNTAAWQYARAALQARDQRWPLHASMPYLHGGKAAAIRLWTVLLMSLFWKAKSPYAPYWIAGSVRPLPAANQK
jgi:hypothetical protein